jgi:hypothetical protein
MLNFTEGNTNEYAILTLTEKVSLTNAYYLFVFTHITTKEIVSIVIPFSSDLSNYKNRYNKFLVNTSALFAGKSVGQYIYNVYEQASGTNTDTTLTGGLLETGKMNLLKAEAFNYTEYNTATNYTAYAG